MLYNEDLDPALARHIIQRMGETGQPPERGALFVNVATNDLLEMLRNEYLKQMKDSGRNSSFKLIQATFGGGKTQFLMSLREIAWQEGFCTARVDLSPKECPFDKPEKIYEAVAKGLELPPESLDLEPEPGIDVVLRTIARQRAKEIGAADFKHWLRREFEESPVESRNFRKAVSCYMAGVVDDDYDCVDLLADYLRGTRVPASELTPFRIREQLSDTNAFGFLKSLVQSLSHLQLPGLVMLFDEMDRNMSLPPKRRRAIGDNLRQMIDQCGQATLPGVLWCYAVPPEFMSTVVPDYPALAQRLKVVAGMSQNNPLMPLIDLERLSMGPVKLMGLLGDKLLDIYDIAFDSNFDKDLQKANVKLLADELGSQVLEGGRRRDFVKTTIRMLGEQAAGEEHALSSTEVSNMLDTVGGAEPGSLDGEQEFF